MNLKAEKGLADLDHRQRFTVASVYELPLGKNSRGFIKHVIAGWATGKIMRGSGFGPLMDIVVGIVGAIVGGWIMRALGFSGQGGTIYTILIAILGAVVLTWVFRLFSGKGTRTTAGSGGLRKVA